MKKIVMTICLLALCGCVAGDFAPNRNRLHEMNSDKEICEKQPERCISGVSVREFLTRRINGTAVYSSPGAFGLFAA